MENRGTALMSYASVLRNTGWNLGGSALPILVAVFAIPTLIQQLGGDRFGVLAIGWAVMGYFVLSDFGIGRATTKYLSEFDDERDSDRARDLVWTSLVAHGVLGLGGGGLFALVVPFLIGRAFEVPGSLQAEAMGAYYWLAASIPALLMTSCLRSILEARRRFDLVNMLRVPASAINYLVPLLVLLASNNISDMLAAIFGGRLLVLAGHALCTFRAFPELAARFRFRLKELRRLFAFGVWVAISSLINPIVLFADRFFVASVFSMAAVTYYVTPYEVVTKLWILSASLLGALFPVLSVTDHRSPEMERIVRKAFILLTVTAAPAVGILLVFGRDLLGVWIDAEFARQSGTVAKWLAVGVFVNILAQIPFTVLQATGRPGTVARLQLIQLPVFILLAWWLSRWQGTVGVAMAWALRALTDALLLHLAATRRMEGRKPKHCMRSLLRLLPIPMFLAISWALESIWRDQPTSRTLGFIPALFVFSVWLWQGLLGTEERTALANAFLRRFSKKRV